MLLTRNGNDVRVSIGAYPSIEFKHGDTVDLLEKLPEGSTSSDAKRFAQGVLEAVPTGFALVCRTCHEEASSVDDLNAHDSQFHSDNK